MNQGIWIPFEFPKLGSRISELTNAYLGFPSLYGCCHAYSQMRQKFLLTLPPAALQLLNNSIHNAPFLSS